MQDIKEINCAGVTRNIKINRFLFLAIAANLLVYTCLLIFAKKTALIFPVSISWVILTVYAIISEIILNVVNNATLHSEKICNSIFNFNITLTTLFLLVITFITGNKEYAFLCLVPVFQTVLERKPRSPGVIMGIAAALILSADINGWFYFPFLPAIQVPVTSKLLAFLSVFAVLGSIGFLLAKTITFTQGKADYLHSIATTDALTGLINRREFNLRLSEEFARAKRHKSQLSLALFDIDFFKKINDTHGHNAGDAILRELGKLISTNTRTCDIAARYGGEEFALILPETSQSMAYELMDRLRGLVELEIFNKTDIPIKATISIGVAQLDLTDTSPLDFCERTDKALYKAKESGRNRVERAPFGVPKVTISIPNKTISG